ncbi:MAG TPA: carboxypeptidase-like regulatory domain-containing protein, partial [Vicinamibacterales bacterium]|nr:carboxypeptidase-like regulatory domain-containing protein [Vicinamibacterales bacterium]
MTRRLAALAVLVSVCMAPTAFAQAPRPAAPPARPAAQPRDGRLIVTVIDQTNAILPHATVKVVGIEDATKKPLEPVEASDDGVASIDGLVPGRYSVQAEFAGFETNLVKDTRVRAGDNKLTLTLSLEKMTDSVTVASQDGADPHGSSFGTALTDDQVDALSDDPDTLAQQLADLGGPGATIRVDSFEGGQLPPKSQIKSIHVTRDGFAAENHSAGQIFVEIVTQPGVGPFRGGINTRIRNSSLNGRNQITDTTQPEQITDGGFNIGGSLIKNKASFS